MSTKAPCGPEIICPAFATFTDAYLAILGGVTGGPPVPDINTR